MTTLRFTKDNMPTPEEFRQLLREAMEESNPIDELLEIATELREYEQRYGMSSAEFFERYQHGELDDELQHCIGWASAYRLFAKLKERLEVALMREAVWRPELGEVAT